MSTEELHALVRLLQEKTPLQQISNMKAHVVFEFMLHRGYTITKPAAL
jgi:hypothetical protein